jgi:magnesium-transporting ATPase (P-type)
LIASFGNQTAPLLQTTTGRYGANRLPPKESKGLLELIKEALEDPTLVMLCIAAAVSLVLGIYENPTTGWIEGTAILAAVVIVVMVASLNDYQKEKQFRKLNEKKDSRVRSCAEHYPAPALPCSRVLRRNWKTLAAFQS